MEEEAPVNYKAKNVIREPDQNNRDIMEDLEKLLLKIFLEEDKPISPNDKNELKKIAEILREKDRTLPFEKIAEFFEKNLKHDEFQEKSMYEVLMKKKSAIFTLLNELDDNINENKNELKQIEFNNGFDFQKFREENRLSEEKFSNQFLLSKLIENNWDQVNLLNSLFD